MSEFLINNCWLISFFPLLGGLSAAAGGRWLKECASWPVILGIGIAFVLSFTLLFVAGQEAKTVAFRWIEAGSLKVPIELRVDGLTTMMLVMVTFVSTLVAIYATGYMRSDPGFPRFFAVVGLFVFSMTGLVLSGNYLLTYACWEGVGACSYLLIGFWHAKPSAAAAAKKAFLVNRVGDVGFAIAIFWMWNTSAHPDLSYESILSAHNLAGFSSFTAAGIALLLFWAATAKSAQLPLYVWLPDAMEGPTPVSALIHAATMVTAGVYLIARSMPLIALAPGVQMLICVIGCLTALLSASIALTQTDLKRVLAYSTVSQLGYMFMALGAGVGNVAQFAVIAGMFHLFTHAFFKACLFLGSGSVMHSMGGVIDMRRFGGLRHRMPHTHITFAIGALALSGIFPFAGFFSKDEVLLSLKAASNWTGTAGEFRLGWVYSLVYWLALITAFMTAFYTGRAYFMTFWGPEKLPSPDDPEAETEPADAGHDHDDNHAHSVGHDSHLGHESGPSMTVPLYILAACAAIVGVLFGNWTGLFEHHLEKTFEFDTLGHLEHVGAGLTPYIGLLAGLAGIGLSYMLYFKPSPISNELALRLKPLYEASLNKFYVDEFYQAAIIRPLLITAKVIEFLDLYLVDGIVQLVSWLPRVFGKEVLAPLQNGLVQFYVAATAIGIAGLFWILLIS